MPQSREQYGLIMGFIGMLTFSLSLPGTRYLVPYLSPIDIGLCRALIASAASIVFLLYWRRNLPNWRQCLLLLLAGGGIAFGFPILTAVGMQTAPSSHGAVILAGMPLMTAIFGALFAKERPSWGFWLVSLIGLALVVLFALITQGDTADFGLYRGDMALLGAVVFAGVSYAAGGKLAQEMSGGEVICWCLVITFPVQLWWGFFSLDTDAVWSLDMVSLAVLLFLGLICNLIGFFFWYGGLAAGGIARISQLQYLQPFLTVAFSVWLLGESLSWLALLFLSAVIAVIALSRKMRVGSR